MGAVFEARRPGHPPVALKVLLPGADPDALARFDREAKILRQLDAPGIVRILDYGFDEGRAYLVQDLCPEGDLAGLLKKRGRLEPEAARALTLQLAEALEAAHQVGVVHRDVKPANVLLADGRPKLTDFGLARAKGIDRASLTETGVFLGTPAYMAPEQLLDAREVDERSDVYALGVLLYELLSGVRPFRGSSALAIADAVLNGQPPPLPSSLPSELRSVALRAMAREPQERYASAAAFALALRPSPGETTPSPSSGLSPVAIASLALVGVLSLATLGLYGVSEDPPPPSTTPASSLTSSSSPLPSTLASPSLTPQPSASPTSTSGAALAAALELCRDPATREAGVAQIEALAAKEDPQAWLALGRLLLGGFGIKRNRNRAGNYLSRARDEGIWEASLLLPCCRPPNEWPERRRDSLREIEAQVRAGEPAALRFVVLNRNALLEDIYRELLPQLKRSQALRELDAFSLVQTRAEPLSVVIARLRESQTPEARFSLCRIALLTPRPLEVEPKLMQFLEQAALEGNSSAAGILGEALTFGQIKASSKEEGIRWLEYAALRGRGDSSFARWRAKREDPAWLELAAGLGHNAALAPLGDMLSSSKPREAEVWLEAAYQLRRAPRTAGLLAELRRKRAPREAMNLAREAASQPDEASLLTYAELLLDPQAGRADPWRALEIQGARACLGDGLGALEAARISEEMKLSPDVARALLRRALYSVEPRIRSHAETRLARLTQGISATAPVASQSQLVLRRRAAEGDRAAVIEIGRRASREAPGGSFEEQLRAAAATGDLESRLRLVRFRSARAPLDSSLRGEFQAIGEAGLYEAWLYVERPDLAMARALRARLEPLTAAGQPEALYALGALLYQRQETRDEGRALLERAKRAGLDKATEFLLPAELARLSGPQLNQRFERETRDELRTKIALALLARPERDLQRRGRRALLVANLLGARAKDALELGKHLVYLGGRLTPGEGSGKHPDWSVGSLWVRVAAQKKLRLAQILLGQLYLDVPQASYRRRGFHLVEEIARKAGLTQAKLLLGTACLNGHGTPVDLDRAERELREIAPRSAKARARLGDVYAAQGRTSRALDHLERELASNNLHARLTLVRLHLRGRPAPASVARGLELLRAGADAGEPPACMFLADIYKTGGYGIRRDPAQAKLYFQRAQQTFKRRRRPPR
jgi:eukaryotic-like serine/threonine-protein kinase